MFNERDKFVAFVYHNAIAEGMSRFDAITEIEKKFFVTRERAKQLLDNVIRKVVLTSSCITFKNKVYKCHCGKCHKLDF